MYPESFKDNEMKLENMACHSVDQYFMCNKEDKVVGKLRIKSSQ